MYQILIIIAFILIIYVFNKWATRNDEFFKKQGLPYLKPILFFGNTASLIFQKYSIYDYMKMLYDSLPNEKVVGIFNCRTPIYLIRDPQIIKSILKKDFDHFVNRKFILDRKVDTLLGDTIFLMKDQKWREMRSMLNIAFTGSKIKQMHNFMVDCSHQMVNHLEQCQFKCNGNQRQIYKMKDIFAKFTTDCITMCEFGIHINSFTNENTEFYKAAKTLINFTAIKSYIKMFFIRFTPIVMKLLNIEYLDTSIKKFFGSLFVDIMNYHEKNNVTQLNIINTVIQIKKNTMKENVSLPEKSRQQWTDNELIAQCFILFMGGFDSISTALSSIAYELARHSDVQYKLCEEIDEKILQLDGQQITYDEIQEMKYLNMVITEGLRVWPGVFIERNCVKDYRYQDDTVCFTIPKGYQILISLPGLHFDSQYYPNPNEFDPERFNDENKSKYKSTIYLPFGDGPRNCIGSRFALLTMKTILFHLLSKFTFEICEKTKIPLTMTSTPLGIHPFGLYLEFKPRN